MEQSLEIRPEANKSAVYELLLTSLDDGVWLWNLNDGQFDAIGNTAKALFSSELNRFNQDPERWIYMVYEPDRKRVLKATTDTLFKDGRIDIEYRIAVKGKQVRWVRDRRRVIYGSNSKPDYIQGILQDVTQQKDYQRRLEDSEFTYKVMFLHHPNPMWVVSCVDGRILEVNEASARHYGFSRKEFAKLKYSDLLAPADVTDNEPLKTNQTLMRAFHQKKNGEVFNVLITSADFVYLSQPTKLVMAIDITREIADKQLIQDLNKRLADFKYALTSSAIVSITDEKGIINYVNDNFLKISGYERAELIGSNHNIVNSSHHPREFFKNMWSCICQGKIWRDDIKNRGKNGQHYWVDTYIVPLLDENQRPYQYISIRSDITQKKKTEAELEVLNHQLEERVRKRTQALELANSSLQDFAYSISHDLRAPVRHIRNFAQIVLQNNEAQMDEESQRYQGYVIQATERLSQQIEGLLEFSRVGSKLMNYRLVDTQSMIKRIASQVQQQYPEQHIHFYMDALPKVMSDEVLLEQVFTNLVSNAVKYSSKQSESEVTIAYEEMENHHQFMVKDNGVGFDMAYAPKLFGMFSRLHSKSEFEGNGIGLANARRIVERHDGRIWAQSAPGEGAAFYFTLSKHLANERQT